MKTIIILVVITVVILGFVFWPRRKEHPTDYKEEEYKPSGKKWVFNGLLYIDNPPEDSMVFSEYEGEIKLITKKGYVQYEMTPLNTLGDDILGMYYVDVIKEDGFLSIQRNKCEIAKMTSPPPKLAASVAERRGEVPAYCFVARHPDKTLYGAICISR